MAVSDRRYLSEGSMAAIPPIDEPASVLGGTSPAHGIVTPPLTNTVRTTSTTQRGATHNDRSSVRL